jgi:hypothetical protein
MTYWATLWYAGSVVLTMGYEGQSLNDCNMLGQVMMFDITSSYMDPTLTDTLTDSQFSIVDEFSFSCETERFPINERYLENG